MDDYDRELDRLKIAEMISTAQRRSLLLQINEDFHRIKAIHNEVVLIVRNEEKLNYDRLVELGTEIKKRSKRLRSNLALPLPEDSKENIKVAAVNDVAIKESVVKLHSAVVSFFSSPLFSEPGRFEVNEVNQAGADLQDIILMSDRIKSVAKGLRRATVAKKP